MTCIYIYALRDPDTDDIHYVGQSSNPAARLQGHMRNPATKLEPWLAKLAVQGRKPVIQILEETTSMDADEKEQFWIRHMAQRGCSLLNSLLLPAPEPRQPAIKFAPVLERLRANGVFGCIRIFKNSPHCRCVYCKEARKECLA